MVTTLAPPIRVLLVEDDDVDAEAFERGMRKHGIGNPVINARDGSEALRLLRAESVAPHSAGQWIVLLDLNLPGMSGFELLDTLRAEPALADTVVFVLTSSAADRDRIEVDRRHIAGYLVKSNMGLFYQHLAELLDSGSRNVQQDLR